MIDVTIYLMMLATALFFLMVIMVMITNGHYDGECIEEKKE